MKLDRGLSRVWPIVMEKSWKFIALAISQHSHNQFIVNNSEEFVKLGA